MKKNLFTTLFFVLFSTAALAAPTRNYDVQVLVFAHLTPGVLQSEQWPLISPENANTTNETVNPASELQREKRILSGNPHYKILLDASWTEHWSGNQSSISIPILSTTANATLSGTMTIALSHYFDVHTNLFLTMPTNTLKQIDINGYFNKINQPNFTFRLLQNRRMRSEELNYVANPVIGMLIKIIPNK